MRVLTFAAALILLAGPASAGPLAAAITTFFSTFATTAVGTFLTTTFVGRLLVSVGASLLLRALTPKPEIKEPGIRSQQTLTGSQNPQGFILGRYATGGSLVCPPMSHGNDGDTPNALHTLVIQLCDVPGASLSRVILDSSYVSLGGTAHAAYGLPVLEAETTAEPGVDYTGYAWVKFYDGSQTVADPMLLAKYGDHPLRPWSADMIGRGICYAVVTLRFNRNLFQSLPGLRFEVDGIPLYDPREDDTVGGVGDQRWANRSTWAFSANPFVMIYNILRGITLTDGQVWGGGFSSDALPVAHWMGLMDACDELVSDGEGGFEPAWRAGLEVFVADEPASVVQQLLEACGGQLAEVGGQWKGRVGGPGLPVLTITDDDLLADAAETEEAFPPLDRTYNAVTADYPDPGALWEPASAPGLFNSTWTAEDGDRQLVAELQLSAVPYPLQVQRLMSAYIADERRFRRHALTLPPDAEILEPLDSIAWTSEAKGYVSKVFEVSEVVRDLRTRLVQVSLRERDDEDWAPPSEYQPVQPPAAGVIVPPPQEVPDFAVETAVVLDAAGDPRAPAIRLFWDPAQAEDVVSLKWEIRPTTQAFKMHGLADVAAGEVIVSDGLVRSGEYEVRARLITARPTIWTDWLPINAGNVARVVREDLDDSTFIGAISASWIGADSMSVRYLEVDEVLTIDAINAGFSMGKINAFDQINDGIYMGTTNEEGALGFGLLAGREQADGKPQFLQITKDQGLRLLNARHRVTGSAPPVLGTITTSQTIVLDPGTQTLSMQILGGGGGGASGNSDSNPGVLGQAGGNTRVELWDGSTNTGIFWESTGGLGGVFSTVITGSGNGGSSLLGAGGLGATWALVEADEGPDYNQHYPATAASGYGAGGGGGHAQPYGWQGWRGVRGLGGGASALVTVSEYNLGTLELADPRLVVTIGAAGAGSPGFSDGYSGEHMEGQNGSPGWFQYSAQAALDIPADVVPLVPTATGTFSKPNGGAATSFPDLGPGLWQLDTSTANVEVNIGRTEIDDFGSEIYLNSKQHSFFSQKTPLMLAPLSNSRTVHYKFYSMSEWGGT